MRKLCIILLLMFFLVGMAIYVFIYFIPYIGWQYVAIPNVGAFKVPGNWVVTRKDTVLYVTDKPIENEDYKVYLTGLIWSGKKDHDYDEVIYKLFGNVEYIKPTSGAIFSNDTAYTLNEYIINGNGERKYCIRLSNFAPGIEFTVWDNSIDEDTVKKIAISYEKAHNS